MDSRLIIHPIQLLGGRFVVQVDRDGVEDLRGPPGS
jgi:hypothetical protein